MKKHLLLLVGLLTLVALLTVVLLGYAMGTNSGLQTLLATGKKYAPGDLDWDQANGRLLGSLELRNIRYRQDNGLRLNLHKVSLDWQPAELLSRQLRVHQFHIDGLDIHLPESSPTEKASTEPLTLPDIHLPLGVDIRDIRLRNIRIYPYQAKTPITINQLRLVASMRGDTLHIRHFAIASPEASANLSGDIQPQADYPLDLKLDWRYEHADFGSYSGHGSAHGDLAQLQITHQISGAARGNIKGQLANLISKPAWNAQVDLAVDHPGRFTPHLEQPVKAQLISKGDLDSFSASGQLNSGHTLSGPFSFQFSAQGNTSTIKLQEALLKLRDQPAKIKLHGNIDIESQAMNIQGKWASLQWPLLGRQSEFSSPKGRLSVQGSAQAFTAEMEARINGRQLVPLNFNLRANRKDKLLTLSKLSLHDTGGNLKFDAKGEYELEKEHFQATGNWQALAWPLNGDAQIKSPVGKFKASGLLKDYRFNLSTSAKGANLPEGNWKLSGQGSDQALHQFKLTGKTLEGTIHANGNASWKPEVSWKIALTGNGLNPAAHWPELPGNFHAEFDSAGKLTADGPESSLNIKRLSGRFRGQKVEGKGQIKMRDKTLDVHAFNLGIGQTRFSANGHLDEQWNLKWKLVSPNLAKLAPDLTGSINASGALNGTPTQPKATLNLDLRKLTLADNHIKRLKGSAQINASSGKLSRLNFQGADLVLGGLQWDTLLLKGRGTPEKHAVKLKLKGQPAHIAIALKGGLKGQQWIGQLHQLAAFKTALGDWTLKQPVPIKAGKMQARLKPLCLISKPAELCLSGEWDTHKGSTGNLTLNALEANRFKQFLPEGMQIDTALSGHASGVINAQGTTTAAADFSLRPGKLNLDTGDKPLDITFKASTLNAKLLDNKGSARMNLNLGELGKIHAQSEITDLKGTQRLSGKLDTRFDDLTLISTFVPQLQAIEGQLLADLQWGGTLKTPSVTGALKLMDFAAEVPQVAIHITDTQLTARSNGNGLLIIKGSSHSGKGALTLSGQLDPARKVLQLNIKGDKFQAAHSNLADAVISPDLNIEMDSKGMKVKGKLLIPRAHINARGAGGEEGVIAPSSDVVFVEENDAPEEKAKGGNLDLHVRVILGDDIKVEAADFHGALKGNLLVEQTPELAPRGTGTIEVVNGDFLVYGQQLDMQRGRILFSGGPIDNPSLDMDVARRVEEYNVLAGAKIRGTAQAPLMQLYSEPSMPDASILSYILIGQPPGAKAGTYTLGKYITPDLYVSYGIALFNAISSFNMRYKLTDKLSLKAASGAASSADLIYTIER